MKTYSVLLIIVFCLTTNIFSQVQFASHIIVGGEYSVVEARSVYAIDLDGDGDMDVLSASNLDNKIAWYENDGNENFTPHIITTGADVAISVYAVDVDDDRDMDVLSASDRDDKIAWYENLGVVGIEDEQTEIPLSFKLLQNYPDPFNPTTKIKYQIPELSFVSLKVYDVLGSEITTLVNEKKHSGSFEVEFDGTGLPSGIYFYRLQAGSFVEIKKMILMK